jgi:O-antigen/teichoic acid export membrane protein
VERFVKHAALISYKTASDLAGKVAFFAVLVIAARALTTEAFAIFSLASTLGWILAVATDFGLQIHLVRAVARAPDRIAQTLRPILALRLWLGAAALVLALLLGFAWLPPRDAVPFVLIVTAYVASSLVEFLNYVYRGLSRSDLESTLNLVQRLGTLAAASALLGLAPRLSVLAIAMVVPPIAVFAYSLRLTGRLSGAVARPEATAEVRLSRTAWVRDVLPIGAGIVLSALYFRIDLFLVQYWKGVEEVARYNAVFRLVEALRLFPAAVLAVMLPAVFRERDVRFVWRMSAGLTAFGIVMAAVLYGEAARIVDIAYGAKYLPAVPALRVLLLALPLLSLNYGLTHQVIGWDGQRLYGMICGVALLVNVAMNAVLIPRLASVGAAWSTLGTEVFVTIACVAALVYVRPRDTF